MTWMTGEEVCHSNFMDFAALLGYEFRGATTPCGMRMHVDVLGCLRGICHVMGFIWICLTFALVETQLHRLSCCVSFILVLNSHLCGTVLL
jgi:hypothetical protein